MREGAVAGLTACLALAACRSGFDEAGAIDASTTDSVSEDAAEAVTCGSKIAQPLPANGVAAGSTRFEDDVFFGSCGGADSPEALFYIDVNDEDAQRLRVKTTETTFSPVIYVRRDCSEPAVELDCADENSSEGLLIDNVAPGRYFLFADGAGDSGLFELETVKLDRVGATCTDADRSRRCDIGLECDSTCEPATCAAATAQTDDFTDTGSTVDAPKTHAGSCGGLGGLDAPEVAFEITLSVAVSNLNATTDLPGTDYDSLIYLRSGCLGSEIACNDDSNEQRSEIDSGPLQAGTYFLFVDGFNNRSGNFELAVTVTP